MPYAALDPTTAQAAPATTIGAPLTSTGETLLTMRAKLDKSLGGRDDLLDSDYNGWINEAYQDICTALDLDELKSSLNLTLVAAQPLYKLPYVVSSIMSLGIVLPESSNSNKGYPLDKIDLQSYRTIYPDSNADPRMFFRMNDVLVLYPTPVSARALAIDFRLRPLPMTADNHSPIIGQEWHEGIVLGARYRGWSTLQQFDKAAISQQEYASFLRRRTDREAKEDENRIVGSSVPRRARDIRNPVIRNIAYEDL